MGFLDALMGKKKNISSVPPPAPGPNKKDIMQTVPSPNKNTSIPTSIKTPTNNLSQPNVQPKIPNPVAIDSKIPSFPNISNNNAVNNLNNNPINTSSQNLNDFKIPQPPSAITQKQNTDLNLNKNYYNDNNNNLDKHNYDFSLPKLNFSSEPQKVQVPQKTYTEDELKKEKIELRTNRDIDIYTDNEDIGLVEKRLSVHRVSSYGPIFIEVTDYKHVLDGIDYMKSKLKESEEYVFKIEEYNENKHKEFEMWKSNLEEIQRKLVFVEKTLFEKRFR